MFSNLSQNSILYVLDINNSPKVLSGPVEMVVDIFATINGERREFKGVPNSTIANFGNDSFILADSRESLNSYINAMM